MKTTSKMWCTATALVATMWLSTGMNAQSQQGWRGPNRDGIYNEKGLLKVWPESGPKLLWSALDLGKGYSSPVIVGDRLYITGMNEGQDRETFLAYSLDGKKLYEKEYGAPWKGNYPDTRTTPTIVGDKAYVISGGGQIACLSIADGSIVWEIDGGVQFGRKVGMWGTSECPLVYDNKVIFSPGGDQTAMVALDALTGKTVWQSPSLNEQNNYTSPLLIIHNGVKQIVGVAGKSVFGVNPESGAIAWKFNDWGQEAEARGREKIAPNTPLFLNGRIFICNGYNLNSFLLELNGDASAVSLVWRNEDLDTHIGGFVLLNGVVYGSNWINNGQGNWTAVDWNSGKTLYDNEWPGGKSKGAIVAADDMLYCYDERQGTVGLVKPNPERFDLVSQFRITQGEGPHWAHPVLHKGVLYIRHGSALMAYSVAAGN